MRYSTSMIWIAILYIAQGLPYGVYAEILPVYMRTQGVDLRQIGLLSLIGLAWTLKFLWAPLIENWGKPSRWIAAMLLAFGGFNLTIIFIPINSTYLPLLLFVIALMAISSATNDVAIDGYSIRYLNGQNVGKANGVRVAAYRVGLLICGALLLLNQWWDWRIIFIVATLIIFMLSVISFFSPTLAANQLSPQKTFKDFIGESIKLFNRAPDFFIGLSVLLLVFVLWLVDKRLKKFPDNNVQAWGQSLGWPSDTPIWPWIWIVVATVGLIIIGIHQRKKTKLRIKAVNINQSNIKEGGLMALLMRPHMPMVFLFILLFKLADSSMGFMIKPFWVDSGFTPAQIGLVSINVGIGLSILGALLGGWYTDRVGIFKSLWVMGIWQIASNGVYAIVAWLLPTTMADAMFQREALIYSASAFESFTGGLGTASFLALLMALVNKRFATTEYAVLSALFAASRSIAGFLGGYGAYYLGYAPYFALTMALGIPAFFLLPWVKKVLDQKLADDAKEKAAELSTLST